MQRSFSLRPEVAFVVASFVALAGPGCKGDDNDDSGDEAADADVGTDDGTEAGTDGGNPAAWEWGPIYGVPNFDDDDEDAKQDWLQPVFEGDDEIAALTISAEQLAGMGSEDSVRLTLSGNLDGVRLWHEGDHVLGSGVGDPLTEYEFSPAGGSDVVLPVEFGAFLAMSELTVELLGSDGTALETATVELVASPLIMNHHLQPAEHLWIVQTNDNQPFVEGYNASLGSDVTPVAGGPYQNDRWIQDEIEFSYSTSPAGNRLDEVIDSIRDRGLDNFPEDYFSEPNWYIGTWGNPLNATTFDSFGNLDASPPVDGYPFGRIYYGLDGGFGLDEVLANFLDSQTLQAPFPVDSNWLCVGHVDEFSSFIPDASSPKGFKLLLSDTTSAYEIFDNADPNWGMGRYESAYGFATVADLTADAGLRAINEDIQTNELDPLRERFKSELGLTDDDIIEIPTIFDEPDFCGGYKVALTPGTVNLIVANLDGQGVKLMVPDPFARPEGMGTDVDPIAQDFVDRMPEGIEVVFLDDWYSYHLLDGEVHCGTNVTRTPLEDWWTAGAQLLGLEGGN